MRMRRTLLAVLVLAAGCRTAANEPARPPAVAEAKPTPPPPASPPPAQPPVVAEPPPAPSLDDGPLAWGTRPAKEGPFFPVIDGMCVHAEVRETGATTIFSYGNENGIWSRGGGTTFARFAEEGLVLDPTLSNAPDPAHGDSWSHIASIRLIGTWPSPLFLYSDDNGQNRMRDYETIWRHDEDGWRRLVSWRDAEAPSFEPPVLHRGHLVTARRTTQAGKHVEDFNEAEVVTFPVQKDAPPIPGIATLVRPGFRPHRMLASDTTIYALDNGSIRWVRDGKAEEITLPDPYRGARMFGATSTALYLLVNERLVIRLEGGKIVPVSLKTPPSVALKSVSLAPNGDLWALTSRSSVIILHGDSVTESPLPKPASPNPEERVLHWPTTGRMLAGMEVDDPWAIGQTGSLYHLEGGAWREVPLPAPPFATRGRYQAQALAVPAKGDVYVNAGYAEKGIGWRTEERYRAILRTKRPREVLRCNEPRPEKSDTGIGFASSPSIATEACTTPFVILLRIGHSAATAEPVYLFDRKSDYPSVRDAIKATPSLGTSVDLVEVVSGDQRYLGAKVPSVAAGKALALEVVKSVKIGSEIRPEIVCGTPREARVIHVDVATGKAQ